MQKTYAPDIISQIEDFALKELIRQWTFETTSARKNQLKETIVHIIEKNERNNFLARFVLRDFETWNEVLTDEERDPKNAHPDYFFEPYLISVLCDNGGKLLPLEAIKQVLDGARDKLKLADFAITASKRFRYDTTIRFLADSLKKRGILSKNKKYKNKLWALTLKAKRDCSKLRQQNLNLG